MAPTRRRIALLAIPAALVAGMALAPAASANVYCVDTMAPDCTVTGLNGTPGLQSALSSAETNLGDDTVRIGMSTYSGAGPVAFDHNPADGAAVSIIGAGQGQTTLTMPTQVATGNKVLEVQGTGSSVSELAVTVPTPTSTESYRGIQMATGTIDDVAVTGPDFSGWGITLIGGQVTDTTITLAQLGPIGETRGLQMPNSSGTDSLVQNVTVTADMPFQYQNAGSGNLTMERSTIHGSQNSQAALDIREGAVVVRSTIVDMVGGGQNRVVSVGNPNNLDVDIAEVTLDGLTVVGTGGATSTGLDVFAKDPTMMVEDRTNVSLQNSIIDQVGTSINRAADDGDQANVTSSYSNYDNLIQTETNDFNGDMMGFGTGSIIESTTPTNLNPMFGANHRLLASSPLIEMGNPAAPLPGAQDIDGDPRAVLAVPACSPRRDIGADEFVPAVVVTPPASCTPVVTPPTSTPTTPLATENPECATLRAKLKKARTKKKRRKIRRRLRQLGC